MTNKIWVVYNPNGNTPRQTHNSLYNARCEAERLASLNPAQSFYVMESVGFAKKVEVAWFETGREMKECVVCGGMRECTEVSKTGLLWCADCKKEAYDYTDI